MKRLTLLLPLLLVTCSPLPAQQPEATLPAQSSESQMVPLQAALDAVTSVEQACTLRLTQLETHYEALLLTTAEEAAAAAARPLLVELAGVRAERDSYRASLRGWRIGAVVGGIVALVIGLLAGIAAR